MVERSSPAKLSRLTSPEPIFHIELLSLLGASDFTMAARAAAFDGLPWISLKLKKKITPPRPWESYL
jgi:hypothetical protein